MTKLTLKKRDVGGKKISRLRGEGIIPAVVYGKSLESLPVSVSEREFLKVYDEVGENTLIEIKVNDQKDRKVLIRDVHLDPLTDKIIHIDFFAPRMDKKIEAEIEFEYVGESPAVKEQGGVLVKNMDELGVRCLPADLPNSIEVDISRLGTFDDVIKIKDLPIGEKVEVDADPETVVATVSPPRSEEELQSLEETVEEDVSKVEVAKEVKPKEDEEVQAGEEAEKKPKEGEKK